MTPLHHSLLCLALPLLLGAQEPPAKPEPQLAGNMFITSKGFLAIMPPEGFAQIEGPAEIVFTPGGEPLDNSSALIYVESANIGPGTEHKDIRAFMANDFADFKKRFPRASIKEEALVKIPKTQASFPRWLIRSGEKQHAFERIVIAPATGPQIWLFVLSAKSGAALAKYSDTFLRFVQSYQGDIRLGSPK